MAKSKYPKGRAQHHMFRNANSHSNEEIQAEILAFTAGPNIPDFFNANPFAMKLAGRIISRGHLTNAEINAYLYVHELWACLGYIRCTDCKELKPMGMICHT